MIVEKSSVCLHSLHPLNLAHKNQDFSNNAVPSPWFPARLLAHSHIQYGKRGFTNCFFIAIIVGTAHWERLQNGFLKNAHG